MIGRSIALEFGGKGWTVGLHYHRNQSAAEQTASTIMKTGGNALLFQADVKKSHELRGVLHSYLSTQGSLDVLVWAVGTASAAPVIKTSPEDWTHTLHTNLTAAYVALRESAPIFEQQQRGVVIFIGSLSGEQGKTGQAAYAASKAGLIGLMKTAAKEWGMFNIRVNAVFPGWHPSPLTESTFRSALQQTPHALHRTPHLERVVQTVYHLALAEEVSGQVWNLDSRIW